MYIGRRTEQVEELLSSYKYPLPFSQHLKNYFRQHKNMGSRDRKELRQLSYGWFRLGRVWKNLPLKEQIVRANEVLDKLSNIPLELAKDTVPEVNPANIFPFTKELSARFKAPEFYLSHLYQPWVWIKISKGSDADVKKELEQQNVAFQEWSPATLKLSPEAKLDTLKSFNEGKFRIQDLCSQSTAEAFQPKKGEIWWDACAGAGGKSLALLDEARDIEVYASDIRQSILENLELRHRQHGNRKIKTFVADLEKPLTVKLPEFDGIIVDAPCSGSGTWARNPENLVYFDMKNVPLYQQRQLSILRNVLPHLKKGKSLFYITCSVFEAENEKVIEQISREFPLETEEQKYLEGYRTGAENMFLCKLKRKD